MTRTSTTFLALHALVALLAAAPARAAYGTAEMGPDAPTGGGSGQNCWTPEEQIVVFANLLKDAEDIIAQLSRNGSGPADAPCEVVETDEFRRLLNAYQKIFPRSVAGLGRRVDGRLVPSRLDLNEKERKQAHRFAHSDVLANDLARAHSRMATLLIELFSDIGREGALATCRPVRRDVSALAGRIRSHLLGFVLGEELASLPETAKSRRRVVEELADKLKTLRFGYGVTLGHEPFLRARRTWSLGGTLGYRSNNRDGDAEVDGFEMLMAALFVDYSLTDWLRVGFMLPEQLKGPPLSVPLDGDDDSGLGPEVIGASWALTADLWVDQLTPELAWPNGMHLGLGGRALFPDEYPDGADQPPTRLEADLRWAWDFKAYTQPDYAGQWLVPRAHVSAGRRFNSHATRQDDIDFPESWEAIAGVIWNESGWRSDPEDRGDFAAWIDFAGSFYDEPRRSGSALVDQEREIRIGAAYTSFWRRNQDRPNRELLFGAELHRQLDREGRWSDPLSWLLFTRFEF